MENRENYAFSDIFELTWEFNNKLTLYIKTVYTKLFLDTGLHDIPIYHGYMGINTRFSWCSLKTRLWPYDYDILSPLLLLIIYSASNKDIMLTNFVRLFGSIFFIVFFVETFS